MWHKKKNKLVRPNIIGRNEGGSARTTADRKIIRGGEENLLNMT